MAPVGTATPLYCAPACAESADEEYAAARERVERLRGLLLHSRYWVAAFGRGDPGPTEGPESGRA